MTPTPTNPSDLIHDMLRKLRSKSDWWCGRHYAAWLQSDLEASTPVEQREIALRKLIVSWTQLGETHAALYGSPIGADGVLGAAFEQIGRGILDMLNGECGRFDCGTLDRLIRDIARACGVDFDDA